MTPLSRSATVVHLPAGPDGDLAVVFGKRVASALSASSEQASPDISERLRVARRHALEVARVRRLALMPATVGASAGGGATLAAGGGWWGRLGTLLPALALGLGLLGIQLWHQQTLIQAAAEIDAVLLADDVPPVAYSDPGFIEFLREAPQ